MMVNEPHELWPELRDPLNALAEAMAMRDAKIHLYWTGPGTRAMYREEAEQLVVLLKRRGWELAPMSAVPKVSP